MTPAVNQIHGRFDYAARRTDREVPLARSADVARGVAGNPHDLPDGLRLEPWS